MANEEKLDFTQEPIIIELGYSVLPIVTIAENKKKIIIIRTVSLDNPRKGTFETSCYTY